MALHFSHLEKRFFPKGNVTKGDLLHYYEWVAPYLLPLIKDRPLALKRYPDGADGKFFFQQKAPPHPPPGVRVEVVRAESGEVQRRLIGGSLTTLLYTIQLGAIEVNPWNTRVRSLSVPDYTVIDLDPGPRVPFARVVEVATWVKAALDARGLRGAVKTSGMHGMHIFIPLPLKTSEAVAERVANRIAEEVVQGHKRETTLARAIGARKPTQVYVDAGQNSLGKTVVAAYSVRPNPKAAAPVSTPLDWSELTPSLDPLALNIGTLPARIARWGDLWGPVMAKRNPGKLVTDL